MLALQARQCILQGTEEARAAAAKVMAVHPGFSLERLAKTRSHIDPRNTARFIEALRKAGQK